MIDRHKWTEKYEYSIPARCDIMNEVNLSSLNLLTVSDSQQIPNIPASAESKSLLMIQFEILSRVWLLYNKILLTKREAGGWV